MAAGDTERPGDEHDETSSDSARVPRHRSSTARRASHHSAGAPYPYTEAGEHSIPYADSDDRNVDGEDDAFDDYSAGEHGWDPRLHGQ